MVFFYNVFRYQNGFDKKEINFKYPLQVNWVFLIRCTSTHVLCFWENVCGLEMDFIHLIDYLNISMISATVEAVVLWRFTYWDVQWNKQSTTWSACYQQFCALTFFRNSYEIFVWKFVFSQYFFWERTKQRLCINHNTLLPFGNNLNHFIIIKLHLLQGLYCLKQYKTNNLFKIKKKIMCV